MSFAGLNTKPTDRARQLLVGQYADATNLQTYIDCLVQEFDLLHANSLKTINERTIAKASGYVLDVIGELVGQPRGVRLTIAGNYFGYEGAIGAETYGTSGDTAIGGVYRSTSDSVYGRVPWTDAEYRKFIHARIIKNNRPVTINTIIEVVLAVADGINDVVISQLTATKFALYFPEPLTDDDKLLLTSSDLIPRPVGTSFTMSDPNGTINYI